MGGKPFPSDAAWNPARQIKMRADGGQIVDREINDTRDFQKEDLTSCRILNARRKLSSYQVGEKIYMQSHIETCALQVKLHVRTAGRENKDRETYQIFF